MSYRLKFIFIIEAAGPVVKTTPKKLLKRVMKIMPHALPLVAPELAAAATLSLIQEKVGLLV